MRGLRWTARLAVVAGTGVALAVATNQILDGGKLNWTWAYLSFGVAVLAAIYSEGYTSSSSATDGTGGRGSPGQHGIYLRQVRASVRNMETVGIATRSEFVLRMRQVYVDVSLVPKPAHETVHEPHLGSVTTAEDRPSGERRTLQSFLDRGESKVFAVIGGPGSGKTTLARNTALRMCKRGWWLRPRQPLPILLYLRDHTADPTGDDIPDLATVATSVDWLDGKIRVSWLERRLESGKCVVLLDGLDEVADEGDRARVVAWVRRQIRQHPANTFVITSRPEGYETNPLADADVLQVRRFTGEQISRFLHGWYRAFETRAHDSTDPAVQARAEREATKLLKRLRLQPALYDLAANPLLLTMIASVHRLRGELPGSRAELYAEMCDVLVHRRYEDRNISDGIGLNGEQKERVLRSLAFNMMCRKIRDISVAEAHAAVRDVLRRVTDDISPQAFLEAIRRSGLLVEREHSVYAFAHQTFQEYLAAAQIKERRRERLLTEHVDDSWWRETILLWTAGADATPVIDACLASSTVPALALAFDCEEEAAEVDPETRLRLRALLASPDGNHGTGLPRPRLITGIVATRSLREIVLLEDGTTMCAQPVSRLLYNLFARDEQAVGRHTPGYDFDGRVEGDAPAIGMWAGDAGRFVDWLNALFDDGTTYRLPTVEELVDPAVGLVTDRSRYTIWADAQPLPLLYRRDDAVCPYDLHPDQLSRSAVAAREQGISYLHASLAPSPDLRRILARGRIFARALGHAPEFGSASEPLRLLEVILNLALALDLARAFAALGHRDGDHDNALARARVLARALKLFGDSERDVDRALARDFTLAPALDRALDRTRALASPLDLDLDLRLDPAHALDRAHALAKALDHALNRALDLGLDQTGDLTQARVRDLDADVARASAPDFDRASDLAKALARAIDLDRASNLAKALERTRSQDQDPDQALLHDHDLALDLSHHLDPFVDMDQLEATISALRILLMGWGKATRSGKRADQVLTDFDAYLAAIPPELPKMHFSGNPVTSLEEARAILDSRHDPVNIPSELGRSRLLLNLAHELIKPVLDRTALCNPATLTCLHIVLLAAMAETRKQGRSDVCEELEKARRGVIALQQRADGHLTPNEILLLIRA
jgi:hypothetical protein